MLPGFTEGQWWVQDAAAALPARLFGDVAGKTIADLCAAPGGKTAQLVHAGARVTAVDRSPGRMARLRDNLARLSLQAETVVADAAEWPGEIGGGFDGILVDAPCASTGTIRRHPDVAWLRQEADIAALAALQKRLLQKAVALLKPGGTLVYCTCSLEPEEGEQAIAALLASRIGGAPRADRRRRGRGPRPRSSPRKAICAPCPAICRTTTPGWAASTAFTPRGWLNPDFAPYFRIARADSRGFKMVSWRVSGLIRIRQRILHPQLKARRVGRSTQTHFDADHGPLRAEHDGARQRRFGGAVAAVAGPHRPPDHRPARPAHRRRHPRRRNLCRPLRVRRQDRDLPRALDLRSRAAVGRLGGRAARLRLAAAFARGRYRADPRQCPLAGRRLDFQSDAQAADRPPRRRAGAPRDLAVVAGAAGARRYRRQILSALFARTDARNPLSALHACSTCPTACRGCRC